MAEASVLNLFKDRDFNRLTKEVNILLISDLHYDVEKETFGSGGTAEKITGKLIESLTATVKATPDWRPDLVIVAGDLVNLNNPESYVFYFKLIEDLVSAFPELKNAIFATPGNHDIDRDGIPLIFPLLDQVDKLDADKIPKEIAESGTLKSLFILAQDHFGKIEPAKLLPLLKDFESEYFKTFLAKREELEKKLSAPVSLAFPVEGLRTVYTKDVLGLRICSINSSFFCSANKNINVWNSKRKADGKSTYPDPLPAGTELGEAKKETDRNQLFFTNYITEAVSKELTSSPYPVVTFMHHPYFYMHESEYIYPKSGKNNNFSKLAECSDLIMCGHVHGEFHLPSVIYQNTYTLINGSTYTGAKIKGKIFPLTYALIKVNKQLDKFRFRSFRFEDTPDAFEQIVYPEDRYLPFQKRACPRFVSTELEKVRVIKYLKETCPVDLVETKMDYNAQLLAPQLKAYLREEITRLDKISIGDFGGYRLEYANGQVLIVSIENENPFGRLADLFKQKKHFLQKPSIFFAIDINQCIGDLSPQALHEKVTSFTEEVKKVALGSKYDRLNLNFLYY